MLSEDTSGNEVPIACNPNAVPAEKRDQWVERGKQVYAAVQQIQDLPDGYGFRLPPGSPMLLTLAEYLANERLCCAFLHFTLEIEPNGGPFWLRLTGGKGVKEYLWSVFEMSHLLNEEVLQAAHLR